MGRRRLTMKLSAAIAICLAVASVAQGHEVTAVEDPSDVADEFLDQMSFDEIDNQQNRAELYAEELKGLNQVEARSRQDDLGESNEYDLSSALDECKTEDCRSVVRDLVSSAQDVGEAYGSDDEKEKEKSGTTLDTADPTCLDYNADICRHKAALCESPAHGAQISAQCPNTCRVCDMFSKKKQSKCADRTDACKVEGRKQYCENSQVKRICPVMCDSCPSE